MDRTRSTERLTSNTRLRQRINERHQQIPEQIREARLLAASNANLHRHRLRRQREDDTQGTVQDAVDRLNEITSDLTSILDDPLPQIITADDYVMGLVSDADHNGRRQKRRKLDADALDQDGPAPIYGHYGQVVPGRLKMSIVKCDGGHLTERDETTHRRHYYPENILHNDKSVYCTERDQCSIILRHWNHTPFSMTKIVIKTPDMGFTAPVKEGLIFVAMSTDDLLARTSRYRVRRTPNFSRGGNCLESDSYHGRPYRASNNLPHTSWSSRNFSSTGRAPSRRIDYTSNPTILSSMTAYQPGSQNTQDGPDPENPEANEPSPSNELYTTTMIGRLRQTPTAPLPSPGFNVTTNCDDPSGDEEEPSSPAILYDRQRRRNFGPDSPSSDEEILNPRRIDLDPKAGGLDSVVEGDALIPHARFFIEKHKHVVTVKFDPPVTGRYILVKLWSPQDHNNIDIQCISVYGFAGTHFVPSIQMR